MLKNPDAETLMQDARTIHAEAEDLLSAGDWRNATEKAWLAARDATAALVWDVTGVHHQTETDISVSFSALVYQRRGQGDNQYDQYDKLSILYGYLTHNLLYETFYDGVYLEDIPGMIHEVADYIALAEQLAGNDA